MLKKQRRGRICLGVLLCAVWLTAGCGKHEKLPTEMLTSEAEVQETSSIQPPETPPTQSLETSSAQPSETSSASESPLPDDHYVRELSAEASGRLGRYFKAGDYRQQLDLTGGGRLDRNRLRVQVERLEENMVWESILYDLRFIYEDGQTSYDAPELEPDGAVREGGAAYGILFGPDGCVVLYRKDGAGAEDETEGVYYPVDSLFMPGAVSRPLNRTDTAGLTKAELRILRNQYYALLGREFKARDLAEYFEGQPWYRAAEDQQAVEQAVMAGLFKRNILFVQEEEERHQETEAQAWRETWAGLPAADYVGILPADAFDPTIFQRREVAVSLSSDPGKAEDRGIYYTAEGIISLPVTLLPEEYETVMKNGGRVMVTVNQLTGQQAEVQLSNQTDYGDVSLTYEDGMIDYCFLRYQADSGLYSLWHDSDDTVFKPVYEGQLSVLKGAEEEWGYYFPMTPGREDASDPGAYRRILFEPNHMEKAGYSSIDGNSSYSPDYGGNYTEFDEKGYIKALYFFGD